MASDKILLRETLCIIFEVCPVKKRLGVQPGKFWGWQLHQVCVCVSCALERDPWIASWVFDLTCVY